MTFVNWVVVAGAAVAMTVMPQQSQARFGPVAAVAQTESAATKISDDYVPQHYSSGNRLGYNRVHYRGRRYEHYSYRHSHRRHRGRYYGGFFPGVIIGVPFIGGGYYPRYHQPSIVYRRHHRPIRRSHRRYEPWTAAWVRSCSARYRTFNPRTGYYFYKRGHKRFCR